MQGVFQYIRHLFTAVFVGQFALALVVLVVALVVTCGAANGCRVNVLIGITNTKHREHDTSHGVGDSPVESSFTINLLAVAVRLARCLNRPIRYLVAKGQRLKRYASTAAMQNGMMCRAPTHQRTNTPTSGRTFSRRGFPYCPTHSVSIEGARCGGGGARNASTYHIT